MRAVVGQRSTNREARSYRVVEALGRQLRAKEVDRNFSSLPPVDLYIQWGYRLTPALRTVVDQRKPFVIIDLGYFEDRNKCLSISFNGFHGLSMPPEQLPEASRPCPVLKPWRTRGQGDFVYVYGQLPGDRSMRGLDPEPLMFRMAQDASAALGKPAKQRRHPKLSNNWQAAEKTLEKTFDETYAAVTYTSTAAVASVCAGIPTVARHLACPAAPVAAEGYGIWTPYRGDWLHDLSYRNYRYREMRQAANYIRLLYPQALEAARAGDYDLEGIRP